MTPQKPIVFLVDVDNTLLDNDRIQDDIKCHLEREFGTYCRDRYWVIQENLFTQLGYRDYLGALQVYRVEHPNQVEFLSMASFLVDYPFDERVFPGAREVLKRFQSWGRTVILSDGDVVFQPRKVERSGLSAAVGGHVLIYIHKEQQLDDIERRHPAHHYVLVDDKLRILTKQSFCGVTPPQRLGWAEPRPTSWGFRLGRCVRGCDSGEACGWWGDRRAGVTSKIEAARHDGEGCRKGVSGHSVAVIDGERRTSPHSDDGREDQPDKRRICPMAGLSRRRSLLSGDTAKEQEASLLTERTAGGRRTGLRGNSSVGLLG